MQNRPKPVFALLPVRDSGLRFALPADFDVAAGSDDLVAGSSRNEWIQSDAAGIFCDMLLSSKGHAGLKRRCMATVCCSKARRLTYTFGFLREGRHLITQMQVHSR